MRRLQVQESHHGAQAAVYRISDPLYASIPDTPLASHTGSHVTLVQNFFTFPNDSKLESESVGLT